MNLINSGLVLEGGGLRGQYTAGVLDAFLLEKIYFPYTVGVSAGASIACSYISGQFGRNRKIIQQFRNDPRYLSFKNLWFTGSLFGMDFIYNQIPHKLIPFDFEAFNNSPYRFVTVCTDCDSGEAIYFEKNDSDPLTVLKASASMPFVAPMVTYQGRRFLDGALADSIPLVKSQSEGFLRNVVVLTREKGYRKSPPHPLPAKIFYHGHPKVVQAINSRWILYNSTLDLIDKEESDGDTLVIRPSRHLQISRTEKSVKKLEELYQLGMDDGLLWANKIRTWNQKPLPHKNKPLE